jgi:2-phosphosulfolactate phosphatase
MKIDVILTGKEVSPEKVKDSVVIVVDVLRATSVIITAMKNGAKSVVPVQTVEEALETKKKLEQVVLGGERKAQKIEGFDLSNSPLEYTHTAIHDKNVILTTTNGTLAITRSSAAKRVLIGALLNAGKVAEEAASENTDVIIVNSGTNGQFSMDDFITTGALISDLQKVKPFELSDIARTALFIYESHQDFWSYVTEAKHFKVLKELNLEDDLKYCFQKDLLDVVPEYKNGVIRLCGHTV